jgi:hypothetical protein
MKNMGAIPVHMNAPDSFRVDIPADPGPFLDHYNTLSGIGQLPRAHSPVQTRADNQIIISFHDPSPSPMPVKEKTQRLRNSGAAALLPDSQ